MQEKNSKMRPEKTRKLRQIKAIGFDLGETLFFNNGIGFIMQSKHSKKVKIMKNNNSLLFLIAISCMVLINCNPTDDKSHEIAFEIVAKDNGTIFQAEVNDEFNIALHECVGCAEVWTITRQDSNKISLEEKSSRDRSCTDCVGGSLIRVFRFKCLQQGQSDLELGYFEDTLKVTIDVH